ncbi:MAG TPA: cell division protein FtsB [Gammaproteobacteria bacterium]
MRPLIVIFAVVLALTQLKLWLSDDGMREVWALEEQVALQTAENAALAERNAALEAEVLDLKQGLDAVEERARSELGMVGHDETFYQIAPRPKHSE